MPKRTAHVLEEKWRSNDVIIQEKADFSSFLLSEKVMVGLEKAGFKYPSPIQLEAIPIGRICKDLIVQAKSGTGKTLIFTIIALEMLLETKCPQVLILAPTREVAVQICDVIKAVGSEFDKLKFSSFIGGLPVAEDRPKASECQIAVGTPGRIKQLISLNILKTNAIRLFVIDEADQLLEPSFKSDLNDIFKMLPKEKQVIATSATYPNELKKLAQMYFKEPYHARLNINELSLLGMVHYFFVVPVNKLPVLAYNAKLKALKNILMAVKFSQCLVFCNMISRVDSLCCDIKSWGFSATYISSAKEQSDRLKAIKCLKKFKCKVLVSSDVTSRGIDAENVDFVVNFDLPYGFEVYLHRVGRAGRYGSKCASVTFIDQSQIDDYKKMQVQGHFKSFLLPDPVPSNLISLKPAEQYVEENGFDKSESCNSNEEKNGEQNSDDCNQNKTDEQETDDYNEISLNKSIPKKYLDSPNSTLVDSKKLCSSSENIEENSVETDICLNPSESGDLPAEIENLCSSSENIDENAIETDIPLCLSESVNSQVPNEKLSATLSTSLEKRNLELNISEDKIKSVNNENKSGLECNDTIIKSTCETNKKIVEETGVETFLGEIVSLVIPSQELKPSEPTTEMQPETDFKPSLIMSESVLNDELSEGGLKSKKNNKNSKAGADNSNVPNINLEQNLSSVTNFINDYEKQGINIQPPKDNFDLGDFLSPNAPPLSTYALNLKSSLDQYYLNVYLELREKLNSNSFVNQPNDTLSLNDDKKIQQEIKGANVHSASNGTSENISDSKYLDDSCETAVTQLKTVHSDNRSILTEFDNSKQLTPESNCEQAIEREKSEKDSNSANTNSLSNNKVENKSRFSLSKIPIPKGSTKLTNNAGSENSRKSTIKQFLEINNVKNKCETTDEAMSNAGLRKELENNYKLSKNKLNSSEETSEHSEKEFKHLEKQTSLHSKQSLEYIDMESEFDEVISDSTLNNKLENKSELSINNSKNKDAKSVATNINLISGNVENKQKPMNKISTEEIKSGATLDTESSESEDSSENEVEDKQNPINKISAEKIKSGATLDSESSSESESSENAGKQLFIHNKTKSKPTTFNETDFDSFSPKLMSTGSTSIIFKREEMNDYSNSDSSSPELISTDSTSIIFKREEMSDYSNSDSSSPKLMSTGSTSIIFKREEMSDYSNSDSASDDEMQFELLEKAFRDLKKKRGKHAEARNEKIKSYLHEIEKLKLSSREPSIAKTGMSVRSSSRLGSHKKHKPKDESATYSSEIFEAKSQICCQPEFSRKVTKPIQKSQTRSSSRLQNQYEAHPRLNQPYSQYGQPQPLYNQSVPRFSQPRLQYARPSPQFYQPNPQQFLPSPRSIRPSSQHTQLGSQYVQPGSPYTQFDYGPRFMSTSMQNPHIPLRSHHSSCCSYRRS